MAAFQSCQARTKKGSLCSRPAVKEGYCLQHYDMLHSKPVYPLETLKFTEFELRNLNARISREEFLNFPPVKYVEDIDKEYQCDEIPIGGGNYGNIFKCQKDGKDIVIKKFFDIADWRIELENMYMINSQYVVKLLFIGYKIIGMEYFRGYTLTYMIRSYGLANIDMDLQKSIVEQISFGIKDMQEVNMAHCDLSTNNVMINQLGDIKIIDLGSAEKFNVEKYSYFFLTTIEYREPDLIDNLGELRYATDKTDIWALGVIISRMNSKVYLEILLETESTKENTIKVVEKVKTDKIKEYDNPLCQFALTRMLVPDRDKRADIQEVIDFVSKS